MDFRRESLAGLAARVRAGEVSARDLVRQALDRIEAVNGAVNAFVALDPVAALAAAKAIDDRVAVGQAEHLPLAGIPIGVKDLEEAAGFVTTHGSPGFAGDPPAAEDSVLVARLKAAGCVVLGKTNTPELGWKGETDNPVFGITRNPWNLECTPGGSSGGSAAAIASGMVPLATGSDGGGSIRIPSAFCGLTGLKPSLGRVPSGGPHPAEWVNLSTKGVMAMRARDIAYALDQVVGPDPSDLRSLPLREIDWAGALREPEVPARVAWSPTLGYAPLHPEVLKVCEEAVRALEGLGAEVVEVETVFEQDPVDDWFALAGTYNLRTMERFRGTEVWDKIDPGLRLQLDWAATSVASPAELVRREDACHYLNLKLARLFRSFGLLVTPTTAHPPFPCTTVPEINGVNDLNWARFTYPFNMTRSPAGTVCAGFTSDGLPVGLQLIGPQHADIRVLRALAALEDAIGNDAVAPI